MAALSETSSPPRKTIRAVAVFVTVAPALRNDDDRCDRGISTRRMHGKDRVFVSLALRTPENSDKRRQMVRFLDLGADVLRSVLCFFPSLERCRLIVCRQWPYSRLRELGHAGPFDHVTFSASAKVTSRQAKVTAQLLLKSHPHVLRLCTVSARLPSLLELVRLELTGRDRRFGLRINSVNLPSLRSLVVHHPECWTFGQLNLLTELVLYNALHARRSLYPANLKRLVLHGSVRLFGNTIEDLEIHTDVLEIEVWSTSTLRRLVVHNVGAGIPSRLNLCGTCSSITDLLIYGCDLVKFRQHAFPSLTHIYTNKRWTFEIARSNLYRCQVCKALLVENPRCCSRCRQAHYCTLACQKAAWPQHSAECLAVQA